MGRLIVLCALFSALTVSAEVPVITPDELIPGEAGQCRTEMDGGEMVDISLTILGVLGASSPEGEIVLVRLHGERFEHTGIIAGMSGSPVYVRGRLLGALAFGWAFSKDPIGGVTPFGRMSELPNGVGAAAKPVSNRPDLGVLLEAAQEGRTGQLLIDWLLPEESEGSLSHIAIPVATGGFGMDAPPGWMAEAWRRLGWVASPAGGAAPAETDSSIESHQPLEAGAAISAVLVDGAAVLSAGGTVTAVDGDEVWAFGHPFLGAGAIDIPMARGQVVAVLPSTNSSFKFINAGAMIGRFRADRAHGVWGKLGKPSELVPITVKVDQREYRFRSVRDGFLLPFLVTYAVNASYGARGKTMGEQSVAMDLELDFGTQIVDFAESFSGMSAAAEASAYLGLILSYLEASAFDKPDLEGIRVSLSTAESLREAVMIDAVTDKHLVEPGDEVRVRARFREHGGGDFTKEITITVPSWVTAGKIDVVVADGASWSAYDYKMRPVQAAAFADEVDIVNNLHSSEELVVVLEQKSVGVSLPGGTETVPPSIVVNLRSGLGTNLKTWTHRVVEREYRPMGQRISGAQRIPLRVISEGLS